MQWCIYYIPIPFILGAPIQIKKHNIVYLSGCSLPILTCSAKTATLPRLRVAISSGCRCFPILQSLVQGRSQLVSNPSLRPEPVGPKGHRALRVLLSTDDLNLCGPLLDGIPGGNGALLLSRAITPMVANGLAPLWFSESMWLILIA